MEAFWAVELPTIFLLMACLALCLTVGVFTAFHVSFSVHSKIPSLPESYYM
jgi:hypothetical protein